MSRWEHFPHQADWGVRGYGATDAEAFEQTALAMCAIVTPPDRVAAVRSVEIACEAEDVEALLVTWLNAIIFEMAVQHLVFSRFEVHIDGKKLSGRAWGEPVDVDKHQPAVEVKGATYTSLSVRPHDGGWLAQCVVDV
jgi:SHS2 domain-containing protein